MALEGRAKKDQISVKINVSETGIPGSPGGENDDEAYTKDETPPTPVERTRSDKRKNPEARCHGVRDPNSGTRKGNWHDDTQTGIPGSKSE